MKLLANAKLNLYLKIVGRKDNGYHLLNMVNVPVNIYDEINVEILPSRQVTLKQKFYPELDCSLEKTTIFKAFKLIEKYIKTPYEITVDIRKNIPTGSGMGGGSSDAAFFIKEVCNKFNISITESFLTEISNNVGADVPFFIYNRPSFVEGIGEKVSSYAAFPMLYYIVVVPDFAVSTKWAYGNYKMSLTKHDDDIIIKNSEIDVLTLLKLMRNDLETPVIERYPVIGEIKGTLVENGALKAMMTGSGSAVFGVFDDNNNLETAFKTIRNKFKTFKVLKCKTIGV